MAGTLGRVLRLRQRDVEQARQELAARRAIEAERQAALAALEAQERRDQAAEEALTTEDPGFAAMAARGRSAARERREAAHQALGAATVWAEAACVDLTEARVAAEVVAALVAERRAAEAVRARDSEQAALLDVILRQGSVK